MKKEIEHSVVAAIDENDTFQVETDASEFALGATLNQNNRPVAFFSSRTLHGSELKQSSIEKEAAAIIEAVRHWRHYLTGKHFYLITDQKSISFMFSKNQKGKIKNEKLMRWRIELSTYSFDIKYKPGTENVAPDVFSRLKCASVTNNDLLNLHTSLCHPGVTRMYHFVKIRNLPFSLDDIKTMTNSCNVCAECKPKFYKPDNAKLIKSTQPFERLNMDFKGPLPSSNSNRFMLTIIDEYSRFPFAYACADTSAATVKRCLSSLFSIFGMPATIHTDRGTSFMSSELKLFLQTKGISSSRTTSYNPAGNGQVERLNGSLWKTITLALKSRNLSVDSWQTVLPDALHSIRSLLCTATNATPHERMFLYQRKSSSGSSLPSWLSSPGPVLLKRSVRHSKFEPLVDQVELVHSNPNYAQVRFPDGREDTVSVKQLAPVGDAEYNRQSESAELDASADAKPVITDTEEEKDGDIPRRSERVRKAPDRLLL